MAKSKKNKVVHLTQVKKKGKDHKEDLLRQLEQYVAKYKHVFIFDFDQIKSDRIMELRLKLKDIGRIFSGKNSLVSLTLKTIGTKTNTNFEALSRQVTGHRGLLFTDIQCKKLLEKLDAELPEFCTKLLGYSQIAPDVIAMEQDDDDDDDAEVNSSDATNKNKNKKKKTKRQKKSKSNGDDSSELREVKFVKI